MKTYQPTVDLQDQPLSALRGKISYSLTEIHDILRACGSHMDAPADLAEDMGYDFWGTSHEDPRENGSRAEHLAYHAARIAHVVEIVTKRKELDRKAAETP